MSDEKLELIHQLITRHSSLIIEVYDQSEKLQRFIGVAKGIDLVKVVYKMTNWFPADEKFGLISQMRRAAVSIPSNLAEGQARKSTREFVQFISHAEGSLAELDTQLIIAIELEYCSRTAAIETLEQINELRRMLNSLRRTLVDKHE